MVSALLMGCQSTAPTPRPAVAVSYGTSASSIRTTGFDPNDYDQLADILYQDIVANSRVPRGQVIALGPIAVDGAETSGFNARTFQESLRTRIHRGGLYEFSMVVDAVTTTASDAAMAERQFSEKIREFTYFQENIDNAEDDALYGGLSVVDSFISARLSSSFRVDDYSQEVVYRLNYRISNVRNGQLLWNAEIPFVKTRNMSR